MPSVRKIEFSKVLIVVAILFSLSALAILIDVDVTKNRRSESIPGDFRRIVQLSEIFAHGFGIAIALGLIWQLAPAKRGEIPRLAACAIFPGLACQIIKMFVVRYRPAHYFPDYVDQIANTWLGFIPTGEFNVEYVTQSFPSAHAATAVGLCVGLIWMFPNCRYWFFALAFLASIQRVVAGAHWLSDVLAGAAISVLVCGIVFHSRQLNRLFARFEKPNFSVQNSHSSDKNNIRPAKAA